MRRTTQESRPNGLTALGGLCLLCGALPLLGLMDVPSLAGLAEAWSRWFGWVGLPAAVGLAATGAGLLRARERDPWTLPWGQALGIQAALLATLALLAVTAESRADAPTAGGLVGWALASAAGEAMGQVPAVLAWLAIGVLGVLLAFRIGARDIAAALESVADTLEGTPSADTPPIDTEVEPPAPRARPARRPAAPSTDPKPEKRKQRKPAKIRTTARAAPTAKARGRPSHLPELALLGDDQAGDVESAALRAMAAKIEQTLEGFGAPGEVVEIEPGPTVTRFGVRPGTVERGGRNWRVKVAQITSLKNDLALALAASSIRIEAPVPGRPLVGIEVSNPETDLVGLKGLLESAAFRKLVKKSPLGLALGRDVTGAVVAADLARMPHLLIAGATGSGKSVCVNTILASLLFQNTPSTLQLVLVDPKRVEMSRFKRLPHLVAPVVTEVAEVVGALRWVVAEMDRRYKVFSERGVRDLAGHNKRLPAGEAPLPRLVVVIDELADLMLTAPDETEPLLTRIAQLARATGIHLLIATQRPSVDVVTGVIKANFPARIAFAVASGTDSRVIIDQAGAESLLGRGDMLFQAPDAARPRRVQGAFVSDEEIERLVGFWAESPWERPTGPTPWVDMVTPLDPDEALYEKALDVLATEGQISASLLQRRLRIGFGKARALARRLEDEGLTGRPGRDAEGYDWVDDEFTD